MNINQLHYFCVLAETEHYTKAAKLLSITQPSLTHSIKELEKELEVCLFNKHGRNIKINHYGQFLYDKVSPILSSLDKTKEDLQMMVDPNKGVIHLAFLHSLAQEFIPQMINRFLQIEGNERINFVLEQGTTEEIKKEFKENKIDIAFTSNVADEGITSIPILKQELYLITSLDHPLANRQEIDLIEAAQYPFIYYDKTSGIRPILDELFNSINIEPKISYQLADDTTVCGFVAANLGIAIIPNIFGLDRYPVKAIKIKKPVYERYIYLSYCENKYIPPPVNKFKEFVLNN
ncbi:LysR family transcriptional regulator [Bacillus sp. B15-48]|uniref:LysR family transcriptional regulator n=1 Tax=Bacillus sp. B15-48 TaxID=1548601 RepID=UPI00193FF760|nr:LysR family transcriptional regulator [Bacillus sp. B15-48]